MPILQFKLKQDSVSAVGPLPQLKELSQFVDETANIRPNPRLPWVGQRRVLAQGRHARERGAEGYPQLRAHRSVAHRQHAARPDQRSRRSQQHRDEGARARVRHQQQHAAVADHADAHQGAGASGLRVRVGRRLAGPAHPPVADRGRAAIRRRRLPRLDASRRRCLHLRSHRQGTRRRPVGTPRRGRRRSRERARRRAACRAGPLLPATARRAAHRLQGAHHRLAQRHGGAHPRHHPVERRHG